MVKWTPKLNFIYEVTLYDNFFGIPIWFEYLDNNGGNSNTDDRAYVLLYCIKYLELSRIKCVIGDCEFIGEDWIIFLLSGCGGVWNTSKYIWMPIKMGRNFGRLWIGILPFITTKDHIKVWIIIFPSKSVWINWLIEFFFYLCFVKFCDGFLRFNGLNFFPFYLNLTRFPV